MCPSVTPPPSDVTDRPLGEISLPRTSGTHADVFAAVGLADLLERVTRDRGVRLRSEGQTFRVSMRHVQRLDTLPPIPHDPGYRYLRLKASKPLPASVDEDDAIDYESTRKLVQDLRKQERALREAAGRKPVDQEALRELRERWTIPPEEWRLLTALVTLQGAEIANKMYAEIVSLSPADFDAHVRQGLQALANGESSGLKWPVSTVQIFSPLLAKGYARLKPDSVARGDKTKDAWADPFVEWLRYRGYFLAAVPVFHGNNGENVRLLCPIPGDVTLTAYRAVVSKLRPLPLAGSPPKIDVLATLELARLLIEHAADIARADTESIEGLELLGRTPADVIAGVAVTNFQSMGQARAVSVLSELTLPGWFPVGSRADAETWLDILAEHRAIIRGLREDRSDELGLLQNYRRFLERRSERALTTLLEFAGAYGAFVLRARETGRRVRQFTTTFLGRIVVSMNRSLTRILEDPGFQAVATAVRRATVSAQILKAQKQDHREIRYGLLHELRRTRELPGNEPFMTTVAEFISLYNAENARRHELRRPAPRNVTTEELTSFTRLVDEYGASIVGALLCAFGTCRVPGQVEPAGADTAEAVEDAVAVPEPAES